MTFKQTKSKVDERRRNIIKKLFLGIILPFKSRFFAEIRENENLQQSKGKELEEKELKSGERSLSPIASIASFIIGKELTQDEVDEIKDVLKRIRKNFTNFSVENLLWIFSFIPKSFFEKAGKESISSKIFSKLSKAIFILSKLVFHFSYYASQKSWKDIEYPGPFVGRVNLPRYNDPEIKLSEPKEDIVYFDVCIVGSGAGGSISALELSSQGFSVALFEKGNFIPPSDFNEREDDMIPKLYDIYLSDDFSVLALSGKNLGGSTLHNTALFVKLPEKVFEFWRELGFPISWDTFSSLSYEVFRICGTQKMSESELNANSLVFLRGLEKLNYSFYFPYHSRVDCLKVGFCELGCHWNRKFSTPNFILPTAQKYGLQIFTGARAACFEFSEKTTSTREGRFVKRTLKSIVFVRNGKKFKVRAEHFILSAGAFGTPSLIRNSTHLKPQGLSLHPSTYVVGVFSENILGWTGIPISVISEFLEADRGFILMPYFAHPGVFSVALGGIGKTHRNIMLKYQNLAMVSILPHDAPSGYIKGGNFFSYSITKNTIDDIRKGIEISSQILFEAGAKEVIFPDIFELKSCRNMNDVRNNLEKFDYRRLPLISVHPQATLPWGKFIDEDGRVFGFTNLWVADSSVFPSSCGVPPQTSTMAVSLFVSRRVSAELGKQKIALQKTS